MHATFHGGIFGGHTKGIPAHRVQNIKALRAFPAGDDIAHHIVTRMAHVDVARRIGEHLEDIIFRATRILVGYGKHVGLGPAGLLARFGYFGLVAGHG